MTTAAINLNKVFLFIDYISPVVYVYKKVHFSNSIYYYKFKGKSSPNEFNNIFFTWKNVLGVIYLIRNI